MAKDSVIKPCKVVVIGGSAGSLDIVIRIIGKLSREIDAAIILVMHRKSTSDSGLVDLLAARTKMQVKEAEEKEQIQNSVIYVAPADYHLLIEKDCTFSLDYSEKVHYSRPSIDVTFETAAEALGPSVASLLLSGANQDGVYGLHRISECGGAVAVQDPSTADVPYMPQQAINSLKIVEILQPGEMPAYIEAFASGQINMPTR